MSESKTTAGRMDEQKAYTAGRRAYRRGDARESCPFPAPFNPPRTPEDAEPDVAAGMTIGAFWLDGWEQERDREVPMIRIAVTGIVPMPLTSHRLPSGAWADWSEASKA